MERIVSLTEFKYEEEMIMKKHNKSRKMVMVVMLLMLLVGLNKPTNAYAAQRSTRNVFVQKDVALSGNNSIHIEATIYIDYSYDEGVIGWINDAYVIDGGGVYSNTVHVEKVQLVDIIEGSSSYGEVYYFYGYVYMTDYTANIYIRVNVDEWGSISAWIDYQPLS